MPAHKRSRETPHSEEDSSLQSNETHLEEPEDEPNDSGENDSSSSEQKEEFITVKLSDIRKEVQCAICLGIIRKTRTVMECLHRFCQECIDKSMRLGNNECPACRTHCASRRSLRDDSNYDALIAYLFPDIDKYEKEEFAFHEEEKARNKQIQDSIAQTVLRQAEALGRKRTSARATDAAFARRSQGNYRNYRGRRNHRAAEVQGSGDDEDANGHDGGKESSSADEHATEVKPKRYKRWGGGRFSQASGSTDGGCDENNSEVNRDSLGASAGLVSSSELLAWGRGGMRSSNRHGSLSAGNGKNARNSRLSKLLVSLRNSGDDDELDIQFMLVSLDEQRIPSLQFSKLFCRPNLSIKHICRYVALETEVEADDVEMLLVRKLRSKPEPTVPAEYSQNIDPCKDDFRMLDEHETLAELQAMHKFSHRHLLLGYRLKLPGL